MSSGITCRLVPRNQWVAYNSGEHRILTDSRPGPIAGDSRLSTPAAIQFLLQQRRLSCFGAIRAVKLHGCAPLGWLFRPHDPGFCDKERVCCRSLHLATEAGVDRDVEATLVEKLLKDYFDCVASVE